jgi:hypothetical protein
MSAVVQLEQPISGLAAALAKAQLEIQNPPLDAMNPHFKSRFASLPGVRNSIVPIMAKHGIAVTQDLKNVNGGIACTTILTHVSGQQMVFGPLEMPATKQDAQGLGSAATYARRYGLLAAACVAGEEDDDGNAASKAAPKGEMLSEQQAADIESLLTEVGADRARFLKWAGADSVARIPAKLFSTCVQQLEAKRRG